jgi:hypothetical protein
MCENGHGSMDIGNCSYHRDALKLKRNGIEQKYKNEIEQFYGEKRKENKSKSNEKKDSKEI